MARKSAEKDQKEQEPQGSQTSPDTVALPADSAAAVYRDKSGKSLTGQISEGKSNFGAVTAEALRVLEATAAESAGAATAADDENDTPDAAA